tara:strand:+ start:1183 stop:1422 length:240 start_codon:yes stop_codon:yes gene_type:complete
MLNKLKSAAKSVLERREEYHEKAKPFLDKSMKYCKDNPSDVMLGVMTLLLWDMESDIDDVRDSSQLSAAVDYHDYSNRG